MLDIMSVYTTRTGLKSILKKFPGWQRVRLEAANKVRFSISIEKGLAESVRVALEEGNFRLVKEFIYFLSEAELSDDEVVQILRDAIRMVHNLTSEFFNVVKALLSLSWKGRSSEIKEAFTEFWIDIMVTHNVYIPMGIPKLIIHWIPSNLDASDWVNGCPSESTRSDLKPTHDILNRILSAVPMAFDVVINAISTKFPYFKKPAHVTAGYLFNLLWLLEYNQIFEELILQLVLEK
uniref:RNA polymerase I-specific transcription initiation factor RRN3-like n=1 Tax=Drosophila rhopaloa TaxID=1041015 RepID=A0A6P4E2K2_DRORH